MAEAAAHSQAAAEVVVASMERSAPLQCLPVSLELELPRGLVRARRTEGLKQRMDTLYLWSSACALQMARRVDQEEEACNRLVDLGLRVSAVKSVSLVVASPAVSVSAHTRLS